MREPMTLEIPQTLGLSGQLMYQSENKFTDLYSYITKIVQHSPLTVVPAAVFPSSMKMSSVRIELHPSVSEAKELNLVVRLSTKGMIHSLSKKQITEAQISFLEREWIIPLVERRTTRLSSLASEADGCSWILTEDIFMEDGKMAAGTMVSGECWTILVM